MRLENLHVLADLRVKDLGVVLSCLDVGMSKHLANSFNGDAILKGDGRGEGVPGDVKADFLLNVSELGQDFQIIIDFLIRVYFEYRFIGMKVLEPSMF